MSQHINPTPKQTDIASLKKNLESNENADTAVYRNVWFSDSSNDLKRVHDADFQYNPGANDLKVGTINGKTVKGICIKDYTFDVDGWSAGTPGTRAEQKTVDITSDISQYGDVIGVYIKYIADSSIANYQAFVYGDRQVLYLNAYRATASAVNATTHACVVRLTFAN